MENETFLDIGVPGLCFGNEKGLPVKEWHLIGSVVKYLHLVKR